MIRSSVIRAQYDQLLAFIDKCAADHSLDHFLLGHLGKYSCVSAAGFIENAVAEVFVEFVRKGARPPVADFAVGVLQQVQNPKSNKIIEIAGRFDPAMASRLSDYMEEDNRKRKDSIDSIMANRHLIAHGRTSGITLSRVRSYLADVHDVIVFIEKNLYV